MNAQAIRTGSAIIAAALALAFYASVFTVGQMQQALVLQFGRVRAVLNQTGEDKPGLYFKLPFVENVVLPRVRREPLSPVAGHLLERIVKDGSHHGLVDLFARELHAWLALHQDEVESIVRSRAPTWAPTCWAAPTLRAPRSRACPCSAVVITLAGLAYLALAPPPPQERCLTPFLRRGLSGWSR